MDRRSLLTGLGASLASAVATGSAAGAGSPDVVIGTSDYSDRGDGDDAIEAGEPITVSPRVDNRTNRWRYVRTVIGIDDDSGVRGPLAIAPDSSEWYGREFLLERPGEHSVTIAAQLWDGKSWVTTDTAERTVSIEGDTTASASSEGTAAPDRVVGYYPSWAGTRSTVPIEFRCRNSPTSCTPSSTSNPSGRSRTATSGPTSGISPGSTSWAVRRIPR